MTQRNEKFIHIAGEMAELSTYPKNPTGCIVVYKNKILSTGFNTDKSHPLQKKYNIERFSKDSPHKTHAEIKALSNIINLDIDWNKVSLYTYRKRKDQPFGIARPCKSCMTLIRNLGIRHIFYTTNYGYAHEELIYY